MIELSVVVPMFRSKFIGWLPFESLIRQAGISFEWELIIAEEIHDEPFGKEAAAQYQRALKDLGCSRFEYIALDKWIPLAKKLYLLANSCNEESKIFVWHSADYYSAPQRLVTHYNHLIGENIHLVTPLKSIYYNISDGSVALHDRTPSKRRNDVMGKAWSMDIIKKIPNQNRRKCVDSWLYTQCKRLAGRLNVLYDESDNWKYALSTHGLNNITFQREAWIRQLKPPFYKCPINIFETIPKAVIQRLKNCKQYIRKHKRGIPR